jgi:hypothetical protein
MSIPRFEGLQKVSKQLLLGPLYIWRCLISSRVFHVQVAGLQPLIRFDAGRWETRNVTVSGLEPILSWVHHTA